LLFLIEKKEKTKKKISKNQHGHCVTSHSRKQNKHLLQSCMHLQHHALSMSFI